MNKPAMKRILQIGIIVEDAQKTAKIYQEKYGIDVGNWWFSHGGVVGHGMLGDVQIELVAPGRDHPEHPLCKFLIEKGEGVHHIAVEKDNEVFGKVIEENELQELFGGYVDGFAKFTYYDTVSDLGFIMETYDYDDENGSKISTPSTEK